ncbi:DM13 domain-containing protein [Brasilonema sp. UFV-L1]|uniref:DM13 domain-containing protein n=1 Tax=Brasilonema sp. UFV-L1 TaxID=2234130 RepID=UPI00145D2508|nr:DM13 domain-containing protein [Brasilonema sp. UFV-L1]NMG08185.1 electron transfer protein with DM13 domain protein [Brasilonema sp. UFV-L1]
MRWKHLLLPSIAFLVIVSSTREVRSAESHVAVKTQANPVIQLAQSQVSTATKSGTFVSGEHKTQGTVSITTKNGKSFLELDKSFKTSNSGPDLVVILHRSDNVIGSTKPPAYPLKKGDYIILGRLQKFSGSQTYSIPNNINLAEYKSVAIWCRKFNATFGAAKY